MEDCKSFVNSLWLGLSYTPEIMTVEDAAYDIENFKAEGWEDIPEELTPEVYASLWNEMVREAGY